MSDQSKTTGPIDISEGIQEYGRTLRGENKTTAALKTELGRAEADVVDLSCQIRFMNSRIANERRKVAAIQGMIRVYEMEAAT